MLAVHYLCYLHVGRPKYLASYGQNAGVQKISVDKRVRTRTTGVL
jgi:hypothetical protein